MQPEFSLTTLPSFLPFTVLQDEAQVNVARDIAVQMCDVFDAKDYVGIVNVSYIAAVRTFPTTYYSIVCLCPWYCVCLLFGRACVL
jgi:hypothetical protein